MADTLDIAGSQTRVRVNWPMSWHARIVRRVDGAGIITLVNLLKDGARALFGGARRGNAPLAGLGAALMAVGWVRRLYRPDRELLFSRTLRKGESIQIRMLDADDPSEGELRIDG